jgi:hypothetical protein
MTICIAGMHRSGTSMITRLLNLCGLYLGPEDEVSASAYDNEAGFWENSRFVKLNEAVLAQLGGGWDLPPTVAAGWELRDEMVCLQDDAAELVKRFSAYELWGWKDPRNSIMFPFWKRLIPDLKMLICLRNPLEVAHSLQMRGHSSLAFGLHLWLTYTQRLLSNTRPDERVVTHYNAYFYNPQAELRRVLNLLQIAADPETIGQACSTISVPLRHSWVTTQDLVNLKIHDEVLDCYLKMCGESGAIYQASAEEIQWSAKSRSETGE